MDISKSNDENLSDDYEEGEILDEDDILAQVSSFEEFSSDEDEFDHLEKYNLDPELTEYRIVEKHHTKHQRRKEHVCKENSLCRKERKGKYCFARIRVTKPIVPKVKALDVQNPPFGDTSSSKRVDVTSVVKRASEQPKPDVPLSKQRHDAKSSRTNFKGHIEKENRYTTIRNWILKDKQPKSRNKYLERRARSRSRTRDYNKSRYIKSSTLDSGHSDIDGSRIKCAANQFKTSLLKRLVGSGNTGLKTLKDSENVTNLSDNVEIIKSTNSQGNENVDLKGKDSLDSLSDKTTITQDPKIPEEPPKKLELKWKRSIKEDKDELHLRVEALKSAWVKKFNERKKKGFIQQKKSACNDDSWDEFEFDFDTERSSKAQEAVQVDTTTSPDECRTVVFNNSNFNCIDLSEDIIKPEDMVIANLDKSADEPIISEHTLQIVTSKDLNGSSINGSSVLLAPSPESSITAVLNVIENTPAGHPSSRLQNSINAFKESRIVMNNDNTHNDDQENLNTSVTPNRRPTSSLSKDRRSVNRSLNKSERRSLGRQRKKIRRKARRDSLKNSLNTSEADDEKILREQALLSLKLKSNRLIGTQQNTENSKTNCDSKENITDNRAVISTNENPATSSSSPKDKKIKLLCEFEGTGTTSSDNWEDDLDEDILRAQLLSSLTKQVSENSTKLSQSINLVTDTNTNIQFNLKTPIIKKIIYRKQDKRKMRNTSKKLWKGNTIITGRTIKVDASRIVMQRFGKEKFIKKDSIQVPIKTQPSEARTLPQVPRLIISHAGSDSSDDDIEISNEEITQDSALSSSVAPEIEASIDQLLLEAKKNSQLLKKADSAPKMLVSADVPKNEKVSSIVNVQEQENENIPKAIEKLSIESEMKYEDQGTHSQSSDLSNISATPQALKHLPAWQQEEYRRLKKKIAEKENVLQCTRAKIIEPSKEGNSMSNSEVNFSEDLSGKIKPSTMVSDEFKAATLTFKPTSKIMFSILATESAEETKDSSEVYESTDKIEDSALSSEPTDGIRASIEVAAPSDATSTVFESTSASEVGPKASSNEFPSNLRNMEDAQHQHKTKCEAQNISDDSNNTNKKNYPPLVSCSVLEEINVMNDIVNSFEKNCSEYSDLKNKWTRLKKLIKITESKMALKEKKLLIDQDRIKEKDRAITSKIVSISMVPSFSNEKSKASNRDMEYIKLKHKEVSLKAQFLFHDFTTEMNNVKDSEDKKILKEVKPAAVKAKTILPNSPTICKRVNIADSKIPEKERDISEPPAKRCFSVKEREREEWDPNTPVCHFDLNGICKDEECKYQHFKTV